MSSFSRPRFNAHWLILLAIVSMLSAGAFHGKAAEAKRRPADSDEAVSNDHNSVTSDGFLELGMNNADALRLEGEQCLRLNNVDRAIKVLTKAVELAPSDMDGRILYAQALQKRLDGEVEKEPQLFNQVVKQWLYVLHESGSTEHQTLAAKALHDLTGKRARRFENEKKFLSRVLLPEPDATKVALNGNKPGSEPGKSDSKATEPETK
jgi:tetratricopeptide (TPR) repeat protein